MFLANIVDDQLTRGDQVLNFAMYCKTYSGDFERLSKLVDTFHKYNQDDIILFISAPEDEMHLFRHLSCATVIVISDESFAQREFTTVTHHGMSLGYANQQICKLTFHKTKFAKNYLCLDSDTLFIREFYISDFMHDENTPYTVLVMDKDLSIERHYRLSNWIGRQEAIKRIYDYVGLKDRRLRTCHNSQVFNSTILESFEQDFLAPRHLSYGDLLAISPYEFTWYNVWFQKSGLIKEVSVEPFFKMLHYREEYHFSRIRLLRKADFAEAYVGLILNSKWYPKTPLDYKDPDSRFYALLYNIIVGNVALFRFYFRVARRDFLLRVYQKVRGKLRS